MNRLLSRIRGQTVNRLAGIALVFMLLLGWPGGVFSATNEAVNVNGGSVSLTPSGAVTVNSVSLALVKQARDLGGIVLPDGSPVTSGQEIYFVLFVDNPSAVPAGDIRITDQLNEAEFTYVVNSIETTVVPSGSSDAAIWAGVWAPLTDGLGGPDDRASITDAGGPAGPDRLTIGAVSGQANQTIDIAGNSLLAVRFRVTVK